jgi:flagellar M-ring protein FliF
MNFFQKISVIWQNVSIVQRALLIVIALTVITGGALLVHWAKRPDMKVLYSGLDSEQAAKIAEKISEKGIAYKLGSGGTTIYVPQEEVTQLRLDMAKAGLPESGQKGYSIFDDEKIGISPFVQKVNIKRALQDELAKSIQMIDGVVHARIHIVKSESTLFSPSAAPTSASVVVQLKPGYRLSAVNVAAITHLVAGSVEGLKAENITVVDSQGNLLTNESNQTLGGGAGTVADYRERVEQNLASKVEDMLTAVLGPGRAMVRVSAEIDMVSNNVAKEIYDEGKKVPRKEEIKSESVTEGGKSPAKGETPVPGSTKKGETVVTEYAVPKTVQQTVELPGEIKSLTVAAFVDLSPPETAGKTEEGKEKTESASKPLMDIAQVEEIIRKAVGPKLAKDGLKVVDVKFNRPTALIPDKEESVGFDFVAIAGQASLGITAICALFVLKIFSGARKKAALTSATPQLPPGAAPGGFLPAGTESYEPVVLRRKITESLQSNPEQAKQLFSNWLNEKGS